MGKQKYPVILTEEQRERLERMIASGVAPARKLTHARVLLKTDQGPHGPGLHDGEIADAVETSQVTVSRIRKQFIEDGLEAALNRRAPRREYRCKLDGEAEAKLIALSCGTPPRGQARWSLRLLANKLVELEIVESISYQTIRRALKKARSSPGSRGSGASRRRRMPSSSGGWRTSSTSTPALSTRVTL